MSKKTFILKCEEAEDQEGYDDVINLLTIRILETYLFDNPKIEIPLDVISSLKKLVLEKTARNKDLKMYFVEVDFDKDVVLSNPM